MKVYIPSYKRATTHTTARFLESQGIKDYAYILDTSEEADEYIKNGLNKKNIIVIGKRQPLAKKRAFITSLSSEWYLSLDDDIKTIKGPTAEQIKEMHKTGVVSRDALEREATVDEAISYAEAHLDGQILCGFTGIDNWFYRKKELTLYTRLAAGSMFIKPCKETLYRDTSFASQEEVDFTLQCLAFNGSVKKFNWYCFVFGMFTAGGLDAAIGDRLTSGSMGRESLKLSAKYGADYVVGKPKYGQPLAGIRLKVTKHNIKKFQLKNRTKLLARANSLG